MLDYNQRLLSLFPMPLVFLISTSQGDLYAHKLPPPPLPPCNHHSCRSKCSCFWWTSLGSLLSKKNGLLDMGWDSLCGEKRPAEWWPRTDATAEMDRSAASRDCIAGRKTQALLISCNPYGQLLILLSFIVVVFLYHYLCKIHCSHYASDTTTHTKTFLRKKMTSNSFPSKLPAIPVIPALYSWTASPPLKVFP